MIRIVAHFALVLSAVTGSLISVPTVAAPSEPARDYPISPVPPTEVRIDDRFWTPRLETNRSVTVWYDFRKCEETGRIANFARAGGLEKGCFQGIYFNDSDVMKVIEGAAYCLALAPDEKLDRYLDDLIAKIAAAQEDDGYLYTARTIDDPKYDYPGRQARWSHLAHGHELYNVGHMYEAAVEHHRATGKRSLLDVAIKNADLVCKVFGPGTNQVVDVPGHEEIEIGLVKLYRVTGDEKYLTQAKFFIDMRGRRDLRGKVYGAYCQDHVPLVEQAEAVGHAVRGGYLYAGVADVAALTGDRNYIRAIDRIWKDVVDRKLYLIGSVGQHGAGEGYAGAWKLDNVEAYNETCAAIALALWNQRMFLLHGDAKYADVLERIIYNGFLAGVSLSGDKFFYPNPLECDMKFRFNHGALDRSPWFDCSCCPVNVVRFLPSIPGMMYAVEGDSVFVNLFAAGTANVGFGSGKIKITQQTDYPWNGKIRLIVDPQNAGEFTLRVRIPGWARDEPIPSDLYRVEAGSETHWKPVWKINGQAQSAPLDKGYAVIRRAWKAGDAVELDLPMEPQRVVSHENVEPNRGRVAIVRGPIVYCVEGADHGGKVLNLFLRRDTKLAVEHRADLLGGVTVLTGRGRSAQYAEDGSVVERPADVTMIPYYAWCHRGANEMAVWIPDSKANARISPLPTIASTSRVSASHSHSSDSPAAMNDQIDPKASNDHDIPRHTWWDHRGTAEWVQYDLAGPTAVSRVEVYWFDDTGRGQCRVPKSWRLLYKDSDQWKPVEPADAFGVDRDKINQVRFKPVVTSALRVEVQLQQACSGGILEWRVHK
ncbi:MAG: six-hairpin glycosidase [Planctomycetota bacterium]|nr:MAG: six-hairpin glycosidase [Planctomycetota bacterium]